MQSAFNYEWIINHGSLSFYSLHSDKNGVRKSNAIDPLKRSAIIFISITHSCVRLWKKSSTEILFLDFPAFQYLIMKPVAFILYHEIQNNIMSTKMFAIFEFSKKTKQLTTNWQNHKSFVSTKHCHRVDKKIKCYNVKKKLLIQFIKRSILEWNFKFIDKKKEKTRMEKLKIPIQSANKYRIELFRRGMWIDIGQLIRYILCGKWRVESNVKKMFLFFPFT